MFGKKPRVNPLESRRQLLVAESDLNRAQLVQEWGAMTAGVHTLAGRVKTYGSLASVAAMLMAGLAAFRRKKSAPAAERHSWLQTILNGAGLVSAIWQAFRLRDHDHENK
jgi:hypothetical protein